MCIRTIALGFIFIVLSLSPGCYARGGGGGGGHCGGGHCSGRFGVGGHGIGGHSGAVFHSLGFMHPYSSGNHTNFYQNYSPLFRSYLHKQHHQYYFFNNSYAYISSIDAMSVLWLNPNYSYEYFAPMEIYSDPDYELPNYYPPDLTVEPINRQVFLSSTNNNNANSNDTNSGSTIYSMFLSPAKP